MLPIALDVHALIDGNTPETMHPDPFLYLIVDLPSQIPISNDVDILDLQNDCGNDYAMILIVLAHK